MLWEKSLRISIDFLVLIRVRLIWFESKFEFLVTKISTICIYCFN